LKTEEKEKDPLAQKLHMTEQLACGRKREWREDDGNETREATSFGKKANEERRLFTESVEIIVRSNDSYPGTAAPDSRL
jgi:hypothetical protein